MDDPNSLKAWIESAGAVAQSKGWRIHFPVHPRTAQVAERIYGVSWRAQLESFGIDALEPVSYLEILHFLKEVRQVWTDSGGLQKEAYFMGRPAAVLREATEWTELLDHGVARLCAEPAELDLVITALEEAHPGMDFSVPLYGDGQAAKHIAQTLRTWLNR